MHEATARLYLAAKDLRQVSGQTPIARLLGLESPQVVKNWETRGVSAEGALLAQAKIGCDANWVLTGTGQMLAWPFRRVDVDRFMALSEADRAYVEGRLEQAIEACELATMTPEEEQRVDEITKRSQKRAGPVKKAA